MGWINKEVSSQLLSARYAALAMEQKTSEHSELEGEDYHNDEAHRLELIFESNLFRLAFEAKGHVLHFP